MYISKTIRIKFTNKIIKGRVLFMKINKKIFFIIILIVFLVFCIFILKNVIKKSKNGNNMNSQEIVDYILNIKKYKSNILVQVNSNKNSNKYILDQEYNENGESIQEVIEPNNISGVKIIRKDKNLKIENSKLNLSTIFDNYQGIGENYLDLNTFIEDYKQNEKSEFEENEEEIIMKTKSNNKNKYTENKILYINKEKRIPTKLIIEDNNQKATINIQYNKIEIN